MLSSPARSAAVLVSALCAAVALAADPSPAPLITHVAPVHPQILSVTIEHGRVTIPGLEPYTPQAGDEITNLESRTEVRWLRRGGKTLGAIAGRDRSHLWKFDVFENEPLDTKRAAEAGAWRVMLADEPVTIERVDRKSKPIGMARTAEWGWGWPMRHTLYLHLPRAIAPGERISVELTDHSPAIPAATLQFDLTTARTPAINLSHVGFAPGDVKYAFISQWRGDGGATSYAEELPFKIVDAATGAEAFAGDATLAFKAGTPEDNYNVDHTRTDVLWLDFSALQTPGEYRVVVESLGCSYPFKIDAGIYRDLYVTSAHGLLVHRSGIELGPPHTTYIRPRPMHPDDGFPVYQANTRAFEPEGDEDGQSGIFKRLQRSPKDTIVSNAWGGYMDAGDWDRRIDHLVVSRLFLELAELRPDFVRQTRLAMPDATDELPDLVTEALWGIDCYRRMQHADGGVPGWIESIEHPRQGDASWLESLDVFVTQPDPQASFLYAATAAQAATVLRSLGQAALADTYRDSALAAFAWAEPRREEGGYAKRAADGRHLAALMLYRETGEDRFHEIFLQTTVFKDAARPVWEWNSHDQREAAFHYARLQRPHDATVRANAIAATVREANARGDGMHKRGYRFATDPWAPIGWGALGGPSVWSAARAYELTGDVKHRQTVQVALGFMLGANPFGQSTITGIGHDPARNPLHVDSRTTGQPAPAGISTYGPADPDRHKDAWAFPLIKDHIHPAHPTWPTVEAYFDVFWVVLANEYTVQQTIGPNTYLFGLLASDR